uniref:Uncharacterized protein n=1 Tax=Cacopsylla melanoneura TaxID=428564 RepID=A0A8D8TKV3_9HEMI
MCSCFSLSCLPPFLLQPKLSYILPILSFSLSFLLSSLSRTTRALNLHFLFSSKGQNNLIHNILRVIFVTNLTEAIDRYSEFKIHTYLFSLWPWHCFNLGSYLIPPYL